MHQVWITEVGNRRMWIPISGWQIVDFGTLSSIVVTGWYRWCSRQRWHQFWWWQSVSVGVDAPVPACLQCVCRVFVVPCWQGSNLSMYLAQSIARWHSITAFTILGTEISPLSFLSSRTSVRGFLIMYCISFLAVCLNPTFAILAIFKPGAYETIPTVPNLLASP
jgi:hypothetical protein